MAIGPGRYHKECREIRLRLKAQGVILMVFSGSRGTGFECQLPEEIELTLPAVLRHIAAQIEEDAETNKKN